MDIYVNMNYNEAANPKPRACCMKFRLVIKHLCLFESLACGNLNNQADAIALECGLPKHLIQDSRYLQLLGPAVERLLGTDSKALQAAYFDASGTSQTLGISPNGCITLPEPGGMIKALDVRNGQSLTLKLQPLSPTSVKFSREPLKPRADLKPTLACPREGLFASKTLDQPLQLSFSGDVAGLALRLALIDSDNTLVKTLYVKELAQDSLNLAKTLDVSDVAEGAYQIKLYGLHSAEGIDAPMQLLASDSTCTLHILRGEIKVGGLSRNPSPMIFAPKRFYPG